jgi:hypothetical protein
MDDFVVLTQTEKNGLSFELGIRNGAALAQAVTDDRADFTILPLEVRISKAGKHGPDERASWGRSQARPA